MLIRCLRNLAFEKAKLHTLKLEVIENNESALDFYRKSGLRMRTIERIYFKK